MERIPGCEIGVAVSMRMPDDEDIRSVSILTVRPIVPPSSHFGVVISKSAIRSPLVMTCAERTWGKIVEKRALRSAFEMLIIGGLATLIGLIVGNFLKV